MFIWAVREFWFRIKSVQPRGVIEEAKSLSERESGYRSGDGGEITLETHRSQQDNRSEIFRAPQHGNAPTTLGRGARDASIHILAPPHGETLIPRIGGSISKVVH